MSENPYTQILAKARARKEAAAQAEAEAAQDPITGHWRNPLDRESQLTEDKMRFAHQEAKDQLLFSIDCFDALTAHRNLTLRYSLALASAALGIALTKWETPLMFWPLTVFSIYLFGIVLVLVWKDHRSRKVPGPGRDPKTLMTREHFSNPLNLILASECMTLHNRIDELKDVNATRGAFYDRITKALCFSPLILGLAFGIAFWIRACGNP